MYAASLINALEEFLNTNTTVFVYGVEVRLQNHLTENNTELLPQGRESTISNFAPQQ